MKKFTKVASVVALAATLTACGKTKTVEKKVEWTEEEKLQWATENGYLTTDAEKNAWAEDNGYVKEEAAKPRLEVTFNTFADDAATETTDEALENLTYISHSEIKSKMEAGYSFILMWGDKTHECGTCAAYQSTLANWVKDNHYTVYYTDANQGTGADKTWVMNALGLTADAFPYLYAVIDGEVAESFRPQNSNNVTAIVDEFINKHFEVETFTANVKRFRNLAELREAVADGEKFILYVTRNSCPDCVKSADILQDDSLTVYFKNFKGNFYEIVSEDIQAEYSDMFVTRTYESNGQTATEEVFPDVVDNAVTANPLRNTTNAYWTNWSNAQVAEQIADMVASGVFTSAELEQSAEDFYKTAITYGKNVVGYTEVAEGVLGGYYTSDTTTTHTLIADAATLTAAAAEANVKYYVTTDDGTAFLRGLRSTPAVVASGYASIKDVVVSAERKTIYDVNTGKAIGYKKTVSASTFALTTDKTDVT